ncbi:GDP-mannose 4,6-dehydratase [Streptomyces sp. NBC_01477]|uniref:GDP-mannose 4,6-dehydratase n=1 Tax=Streptomyces sp. NBC_01477 TaxID=2976015 RepID=UPI002E355AC6|nr:GDP-mannose 4,6-dehydratase [Streptomyces sp. NBC_01477]
MQKQALITGITGQDGYYLARLLLSKGYEVFGMVHGQSHGRLESLRRDLPDLRVVRGDLLDLSSLLRALELSDAAEVYNLGALSFVGSSWATATVTASVTGMGVLNLLEAVRLRCGEDVKRIRFYQASSSEIFGRAREVPQSESTPFWPRSPYGVAKTFGHYMTVNYRESYGLHASSGILFNHESPRRGPEFVTRKVSQGVSRMALGLQDRIVLGNLDARRDWGFAGDYVEAMWLMLQQPDPDDYVIATGRQKSVRELLDVAFACVGVDDWTDLVVVDEENVRPAEVDSLIGDASKAEDRLAWRPKMSFEELIRLMVESDLAKLKA